MQTNSLREVVSEPKILGQGTTEMVRYVFHLETMLKVIGVPTTPINCYVYTLSDGADVSSTNLLGVSDLSAMDFTTPIVKGLVAGTIYRLVVEFTVGGNVLSAYKDLIGEL